ncbi:MAG: hypothetical protein AVDCRST_MAG12-2472, partial [uncultured Rubrobacteraceae bacterium]
EEVQALAADGTGAFYDLVRLSDGSGRRRALAVSALQPDAPDRGGRGLVRADCRLLHSERTLM